MMVRKTFIFLLGVLLLAGMMNCSGSKEANKAENKTMENLNPAKQPSPPVIIYKTKGDYYFNVPVIMNSEKTAVVSFPDPSDIIRGGEYPYPDRLAEGYLLDNRGINEHVAFLNITYEEYSQLSKAPSREELMDMILDKDPLIQMYDCGNRGDYKDLQNELNPVIMKNELGQFEKLK